MKSISSFLVAIFLVISLVPGLASESKGGRLGFGCVLQLMTNVAESSEAGKYAEVYDSISPVWRGITDRDFFIERCEKERWRFKEFELGTVTVIGKRAIAPFRTTVLVGSFGKKIHVDSVLLFEQLDGRCVLLSFPFMPDSYPEFVGVFPISQ